jgi:hypothetical protein
VRGVHPSESAKPPRTSTASPGAAVSAPSRQYVEICPAPSSAGGTSSMTSSPGWTVRPSGTSASRPGTSKRRTVRSRHKGARLGPCSGMTPERSREESRDGGHARLPWATGCRLRRRPRLSCGNMSTIPRRLVHEPSPGPVLRNDPERGLARAAGGRDDCRTCLARAHSWWPQSSASPPRGCQRVGPVKVWPLTRHVRH